MEEMKPKKPMNALTTIKFIISSNLEAKIRHLCSIFPEKEWSGVLFYKCHNSLQDKDFYIEGVDLYPMNIGIGTFTEYTETVDIINYQATHPELLEDSVYEGLIHSHNTFATFFSGTDTSTLNKEGKYRNHFLSLIVNNAGKYTARLTRNVSNDIKQHIKIEETIDSSYHTYENSKVNLETTHSTKEYDNNTKENNVEWYETNIIVNEPAPTFEDMSERIEELKKIPYKVTKSEFYWKSVKPRQLRIKYFDEQEDIQVSESSEISKDTIRRLAGQLITGNVTSNFKSDITLDKWLSLSDSIYEERFGRYTINPESVQRLETWIDTIIDFVLSDYFNNDTNHPHEDDYDEWFTLMGSIESYIRNLKSESKFKQILINKLLCYI